MEWAQQIEIIAKIFSQKLIDSGQKVTLTKIAREIDIPLHKYQAWLNGQKPISDDLAMLARKHGFNVEWLLLGIGDPLQQQLNRRINLKFVDICHRLKNIIGLFPDDLPDIAKTGGMTTTALHGILNGQALPTPEAIAKWILHYQLNANFLLANIGEPFLTPAQYNAGKPDYAGKSRQDKEAAKLTHELYYIERIDSLEKELKDTLTEMGAISGEMASLSNERRSLQQRLDNAEVDKLALERKIMELEHERLAMKKELENLKKKDQSNAAEE